MIKELAHIMSPTDMMREMARLAVVANDGEDLGAKRYSFQDLKDLANDMHAPPLVRVCARVWVTAGSNPVRFRITKSGQRVQALLDPEVGRAWERIADRLDGRPTQTVHVHRTQERSPQEIAQAMSALIARHPELEHMLPTAIVGEGGETPQHAHDGGDGASPVFQPNPESVPVNGADAPTFHVEHRAIGAVAGSVSVAESSGAIGVGLGRSLARRVRATEF